MEKTIAAIATPLAVGGISIIRISGSHAIAVADRVFTSASGERLAEKKGYTASYGKVGFPGEPLDASVALVFRAPKSYTGEDVVELSCHGGVFVTREVLRAVLQAGAIMAAPGEFTKRAFLNGKLGLTQAEAVADMIEAKSAQALGAARAQADGALSRGIEKVKEKLLKLSGHLSAWVDYPEEDIPEIGEESLAASLQDAWGTIHILLSTFDTGKMLREGIDTVIAGKPNVGKSSLMNLLTGCQRSIVTEIAGTTRDVVEDTVNLGGLLLRLSDTAGIRLTEDPVEKLGVKIAQSRFAAASLILAVFDGSATLDQEDWRLIEQLKDRPVVAVVNKSDLAKKIEMDKLAKCFDEVISISALREDGIIGLENAIRRKAELLNLDPSVGMLATERQRECALRAKNAIEEAQGALEEGMTLDAVTVSIESAIEALMELSGERVTEEVVNQVFSHFCVGK